VQLWRIVNSSARQFVQFESFSTKAGATVSWRQIAQDGVQFAFENYQRIGKVNAKFNMATANRVDLLVKAPAVEAFYELSVTQSISDTPRSNPGVLLTVKVEADPNRRIVPPMDFIADAKDFPKMPEFLWDIPLGRYPSRELKFSTEPFPGRRDVGGSMPTHEINGQLFENGRVDQRINVNTIEEWKITNYSGIAHPFHIHINPFQIYEIFQPNRPEAKIPGNPCFVDPTNPATWKPCETLTGPFVWWDVFHIPGSAAIALAPTVCTVKEKCPAAIQEYTACTNDVCTVTVPGYFKFRSKFVDYTGKYVLHCHILAHEDRGMMQLVEVTPVKSSTYSHQ